MKGKFRIIGLAVLLGTCTSAYSQEIPELSGPLGNLVIPDVDSFDLAYPEDVGQPLVVVKITPAGTYADGTDIFGATVAAEFGESNRQMSADARYLKISPESGGDLEQWRFRGKYKLNTKIDKIGAAIVGELKFLEDTYDQYGVSTALSYQTSEKLKLVGNAGWQRRDFDGGGENSDLALGVGAVVAITEGFGLSLDYRFKNDVAGEDYSVTAAIGGSFFVGAGKDDTYFAGYTFPFNVGTRD